ncbi:MAG: hypothetical protein F4155_06375 [Acidimicrobiales bacterium]|nr:hypothetical protein [Acidimicrobiales bacterium]MYH74409.1 hypothetical protein [Acidimicrobiales bacterium]MYK72077.1 hypothetical protein [Acidimicrobiales bacterium]
MSQTDAPQAGDADTPKQLTGYCEPWSLRAGETVRLLASSHQPGRADIDITRIVCGDPTRYGPGFDERPAPSAGNWSVTLDEQPLVPGSYGVAAVDGVPSVSRLGLRVWMMPTLLDGPQRVATLCAQTAGASASSAAEALRLDLSEGRAVVSTSAHGQQVQLVVDDRPLTRNRWYLLDAELDLDAGTLSAAVTTARSDSPGRDALEGSRLSDLPMPMLEAELIESAHDGAPRHGTGGTASLGMPAVTDALAPVTLWLAAGPGGERFDGRLAQPTLRTGDGTVSWALSADMAGRTVPADDPSCGPIVLHQLPARAITGPAWDGTAHRWADNPSHFDAVHFHRDDLYDAGWQATVEATLPDDLPSGIYAFRVCSDAGEDRVPFFVRPASGERTADVALLMPTATYMAYANHRMLFEGADFIPTKTRLRPEHAYIRDHPELGLSHYEKHPDSSGVMFSSRRRPVLNLRPGADGWNFTPDTDINAFLEHLEIGHDIVTDEDLHFEGVDAIAPYRVLVTGSHPEYWSTAMLDALAEWQRNGGRLMYLGGNGFYWRVAFSDDWPGAMELRRAEDGVRNWQTGPGESYHAWGGEYGGMWRRQGRAPNEICGIGFAAQGFDKATYFVRDPAVDSSRAAWILDGVPDERIGTSGLGGGAAGQELDRYDVRLGSPEHAVMLASATTFGPDMLRTKEEFEGSVDFPTPDPMVRADMVFYETPNGGAVFSVGSISWFGALARDGYDNDIARITANVVRRFADPEPFPPPIA